MNATAAIANILKAEGTEYLFCFPVNARSYQTVTKWAVRVNTAPRIPALMRRAFTLLRSGRPAPVLIELPIDVAVTETGPFDYGPPPAVRGGADPAAVREAVRTLRSARR